jgi:hypothetical protein
MNGEYYVTTKDGRCVPIPEIDELCTVLKRKFLDQDRIIEHLRKENQKLKDGVWEKEEVARLKKQNDDMWLNYHKSFIVTEEQWDKIDEWKDKHTNEKHNGKSFRGGAIGGVYTYEFVPTSIGTYGCVKCNCGEEYVFSEL